jgi:tetratricopeptide (TPR) repeat protein
VRYLEQALARFQRIGESDSTLVAHALTSLGVAYANLGRYPEAAVAYRRALAVRDRLYLWTHPDNCRTLTVLGLSYSETDRPDLAVGYLLAAIAVGQLHYGPRYCTAYAMASLGEALTELGAFDGALAALERAHAMFSEYRGADAIHPDLALTHADLGDLYVRWGRPDLALPHLERAVVIDEQTLGPDHQHTGGVLASVGEALAESGRCREALVPLRRAVAIWDHAAPDKAEVAYALTALGRCLAEGHGGDALAPLERALRLRESNPVTPYLLAETRFQLAVALGGGERARRLAQQARDVFRSTPYGKRRAEQATAWLERAQ